MVFLVQHAAEKSELEGHEVLWSFLKAPKKVFHPTHLLLLRVMFLF